VLYSNDKCKVFRWKGESWYGVEGPCQLQVRQTYTNRSCVAVEMHDGQLYLNAWILPDTFLLLTSPTDISLSVTMFGVTENYLIHCETAQSAQKLVQILERMHKESHTISGTSTLRGAPPLLRSSSLPNCSDMSLKLVMQCKCKLYVQNEHAKWHSFGSVGLKISQQWSTRKMHIDLSNHTRLVSAMVQSRNVERLGPKRISFLLVDENEKNNVVYMVQVREELTGDKIFEYIKSKNSENGW
jgi:hypothetical protein